MNEGFGLRAFFTNNVGLKVLSLMVAVALFSVARGAQDVQRSVFVDVVATLPPSSSGKMLTSELPHQVRLTLKGSSSQVNAIRPEDLRVSIDLSDTDLRYYYFADDDFEVPAGVTIAQVAPASVPLTWVNRVEKRVPIQPQLTGQPAAGLALGAPASVSPAEVLVIGPEDELSDLRSVTTEAIALDEVREGRTDRLVPLINPSAHSRFLDESPVRVSIDVVRDLGERTLLAVPVRISVDESTEEDAGPPPVAGDADPAMVSVVLRGDPTALEMIDPASVQVVGQVPADAPLGSVAVSLRAEGLPAGVDVLRVFPGSVEVPLSAP